MHASAVAIRARAVTGSVTVCSSGCSQRNPMQCMGVQAGVPCAIVPGMAVNEWLDGQADRCFDRQRAQTDNAKLVATFVTAISAGLVATALQIGGDPTSADRDSLKWLGAAAVAAVLVPALDRLHEADHRTVVLQSQIGGWSDSQLLRALRDATHMAVVFNEKMVRDVKVALVANLILSGIAGYVASLSMIS